MGCNTREENAAELAADEARKAAHTEPLDLYVHTGGEAGEPARVFLCQPGVDNNVAEVFANGGIGADELAARLAASVNAVTRIVALLDDADEWDSETMGDLANILHDEGFKLRDKDDDDAE